MKIFYFVGHSNPKSPIHMLRIEYRVVEKMARERNWTIDSQIAPSPGLESCIANNYDTRQIDWTAAQDWEKDPERVAQVDEAISRVEQATGFAVGRCVYAERRINRAITLKNFDHPLSPLWRYARQDSERSRQIVRRFFVVFEDMLDRSRPDAAVIHNYCGASNLLFAMMCQARGIPFFNPQETPIFPDRCRFNSFFFFHQNEDLKDAYLSRRAKGLEPSDKAQKYMEENRQRAQHFERWAGARDTKRIVAMRPGHILKRTLQDAVALVVGALRKKPAGVRHVSYKPFFLKRTWFWIKVAVRYPLRLKFFHDFSEQHLSAEKYVYLTLHQDPEQQLTTEAPVWGDAVSMIEMISKMLPLGYRLFVREHVDNIGFRPPGFYQKASILPGVTLLEPRCSSTKFIKHAALVMTLNGTAGWEGLLMGRPVLTLCDAYYDLTGLTYKVKDVNFLDATILRALQEGGKDVSQEEYDRRLGIMFDAAYDIGFDSDEEAVEDCLCRIEAAVAVGPGRVR